MTTNWLSPNDNQAIIEAQHIESDTAATTETQPIESYTQALIETQPIANETQVVIETQPIIQENSPFENENKSIIYKYSQPESLPASSPPKFNLSAAQLKALHDYSNILYDEMSRNQFNKKILSTDNDKFYCRRQP